MIRNIRNELMNLAEENYRVFAASLIPGKHNIMGVRLPILRNLAKEIAKEDWRTYFTIIEGEYFEEILLRGMIIGYAVMELEERFSYIANFLPWIDNWSVCDSFCSTLKFAKANRSSTWEFLVPYFTSEKEFEVRFAVVMLLNYYAEPEYREASFQIFNSIRHNGYYVRMAIAWAVSIFFIKYPKETWVYLCHNNLDDITFQKALQKITESQKIDETTKDKIRKMKRYPERN